MVSWETLVFLAIVLFNFLGDTLLDPANTGVISRAAASTAPRTAGTIQRPAPLFRNDINPSLCLPRPDAGARRDPFTAPGGHQADLLRVELAQVRQLLLGGEDGLEQVALLLEALDRGWDLEAELLGGLLAPGRPLDLSPVQRHRGGGVFAGAQRVDRDRRLLLVILAPVDEDLAAAIDLRHLRDDLLRRFLLQ